MGGGQHGVEMVVGGKKEIEREEKERHAGEMRLGQVITITCDPGRFKNPIQGS
jgi:hypothetical protein